MEKTQHRLLPAGAIDAKTGPPRGTSAASKSHFSPANLPVGRAWLAMGREEAGHARRSERAAAWLMAQKPWIVPIPGTTQIARVPWKIPARRVTTSELEQTRRRCFGNRGFRSARLEAGTCPFGPGSAHPLTDRSMMNGLDRRTLLSASALMSLMAATGACADPAAHAEGLAPTFTVRKHTRDRRNAATRLECGGCSRSSPQDRIRKTMNRPSSKQGKIGARYEPPTRTRVCEFGSLRHFVLGFPRVGRGPAPPVIRWSSGRMTCRGGAAPVHHT